jgi:hypothetical protein
VTNRLAYAGTNYCCTLLREMVELAIRYFCHCAVPDTRAVFARSVRRNIGTSCILLHVKVTKITEMLPILMEYQVSCLRLAHH